VTGAQAIRLVRLAAVALAALAAAAPLGAQGPAGARREYRAIWIDTFNTRFATPDDVAAILARAELAHANTLVVQVRRRGDAWYLDAREPLAEGVTFPDGFDPLRDLLVRAHAAGIQVHAAVTVGAIWNQTTAPANSLHVFNQHGFGPGGALPGRANWLTRTRPADLPAGTPFGGYRFGSDFWLDPGHPDAAAYTVAVLTHLVTQYELDGLHLDGLRYPDAAPGGSGVDPGPSVGYNDVALDRFRRRAGLPSSAVPEPWDAAWSDWRREQVTLLLRRIALAAVAARPSIVVSAGVAATGEPPGPGDADDAAWQATEAYRRAFQDWYAWAEGGLLDLLVPLVYRTEHTTAGAEAFGAWVRWARLHAAGRQLVIGLGAYLNAVEGTLRQIRRATTVAADADTLPLPDGVVLFSMGAHNAPVADNPLAVSGPRDTPYRGFDDLASGLTSGRTTAGQPLEASSLSPVFGQAVAAPAPGWKAAPASGHLRGTITRGAEPVDGADVTLEPVLGDVRRAPGAVAAAAAPAAGLGRSDGGGAYGGLGVAPGRYVVVVSPPGDGQYRSACTVTIAAGAVATLDLAIDGARPALATCAAGQ
jgi:uncharacterized lipoprotein YddW (UPF0748 family)